MTQSSSLYIQRDAKHNSYHFWTGDLQTEVAAQRTTASGRHLTKQCFPGSAATSLVPIVGKLHKQFLHWVLMNLYKFVRALSAFIMGHESLHLFLGRAKTTVRCNHDWEWKCNLLHVWGLYSFVSLQVAHILSRKMNVSNFWHHSQTGSPHRFS